MKDLKTNFTEKKESGHNKIVQDKLDIIDEDKGIVMLKKGIVKEMIERQGNKETSSIQTICKKMEKDRKRKRHDKERERR